MNLDGTGAEPILRGMRNTIFVARHGPWNRTIKFAADVVAVHLDESGGFKSMEPFFHGLIEINKYVGRPVDVTVTKDGSPLISDDRNGAIYRVTYGKGSRMPAVTRRGGLNGRQASENP